MIKKMSNKEIMKRRGFEVEGRTRKLYISKQELISHGCKSCMWRLHNQCPKGIVKGDEFYEFTENNVKHFGYCMEYVNFLLSFAEGEEGVSSIWEKFSLYQARMQSLEDYKEYLKLNEEVKRKRTDGSSYKDRRDLELQMEQLRLWWERLNDMLRKGYGRITDRESKSRDAKIVPPGIRGTKTINFNVVKEIEKKE